MRRFLIASALCTVLIAPAASAPLPAAPSKCPFERIGSPGKAEFKRLGELPPANQYLAVYRLIDGCRADAIEARGIGAKQRPAAPRR